MLPSFSVSHVLPSFLSVTQAALRASPRDFTNHTRGSIPVGFRGQWAHCRASHLDCTREDGGFSWLPDRIGRGLVVALAQAGAFCRNLVQPNPPKRAPGETPDPWLMGSLAGGETQLPLVTALSSSFSLTLLVSRSGSRLRVGWRHQWW